MQKRIEDFIRVATERNADPAMYELYIKLAGLCTDDDSKMLHQAWNTIVNQRDLAKWDALFLEETINPCLYKGTNTLGAELDKYDYGYTTPYPSNGSMMNRVV